MRYYFINNFGVRIPFPWLDEQSTGSSNLEYVFLAGEPINQNRIVSIEGGEAFLYDPSNLSNYARQVGISKFAANAGDPITVTISGIASNPAWGLQPDALYYTAIAGTISLTPPSSGILLRVGTSINSDSLKLQFSEPVILI